MTPVTEFCRVTHLCVGGVWHISGCVMMSSLQISQLIALLVGNFSRGDSPDNQSKNYNKCNLGIPHPVTRSETHAGSSVKFSLLLSEFNQNMNLLSHFCKTAQHQISCNCTSGSVVAIYGQRDRRTNERQGEVNVWIFATLSWKRVQSRELHWNCKRIFW